MMAEEKPFADVLHDLHVAKKTGALYISMVETSEDLLRVYLRDGDIYHIRYGSASGKDVLDILEYYNMWGATFFEGIKAPGGAVSPDIPKTDAIITHIRSLNKKVKVQ
jgi:hypothetical protein